MLIAISVNKCKSCFIADAPTTTADCFISSMLESSSKALLRRCKWDVTAGALKLTVLTLRRNTEHVEMVKELVQSRIERETMEAELVRYKLM